MELKEFSDVLDTTRATTSKSEAESGCPASTLDVAVRSALGYRAGTGA